MSHTILHQDSEEELMNLASFMPQMDVMEVSAQKNPAEYFKTLRKKRGLSQRQLAKAVGIYQMRICRLENKSAHFTHLEVAKCAAFFGVDPRKFYPDI